MAFRAADSEIRNPDGSIVFQLKGIDVPAEWSQVAADVLAQKYFRRAGGARHRFMMAQSDVREWLVNQHAVMNEVRILVLVSFSFLFVCLLNAMGLMLAKIMGRSGDISVRRALGANRRAVFAQCLIEAGVVGIAGGLLGLALTMLGLIGLRSLLSDEVSRLTHLSATDISLAVLLGVLATIIAGLYPTWRAVQVQPAWQLKAQ